MQFGLSSGIREAIVHALRNNNVIKAVLFGSRARGDFSKTSDIDIAVKLSKDSDLAKLKYELEKIRCIYKFDIINLNKINNETLLKNIMNEGINIDLNIFNG